MIFNRFTCDCPGGNSTHIDLFVRPVNDDLNNNQWELLLKGSSRVRAVETIKMALALGEHDVPVRLVNAEALLRMLTGEDYIGLVPHDVQPKYCHALFPKEDKIIDFMNPWYDIDEFHTIEKLIYWYPMNENNLSITLA